MITQGFSNQKNIHARKHIQTTSIAFDVEQTVPVERVLRLYPKVVRRWEELGAWMQPSLNGYVQGAFLSQAVLEEIKNNEALGRQLKAIIMLPVGDERLAFVTFNQKAGEDSRGDLLFHRNQHSYETMREQAVERGFSVSSVAVPRDWRRVWLSEQLVSLFSLYGVEKNLVESYLSDPTAVISVALYDEHIVSSGLMNVVVHPEDNQALYGKLLNVVTHPFHENMGCYPAVGGELLKEFARRYFIEERN